MRIIDKKVDFYDYLSNIYHDDSLTFDRSNSYMLKKEDICYYLRSRKSNQELFSMSSDIKPSRDYFMLLQVCNMFWLFLITITKTKGENSQDPNTPTNYSIELISNWENYSVTRKLMNLNFVRFNWKTTSLFYKNNNIENLINAVNLNDYDILYPIINGEDEDIPILISSGLSNYIDPLDIYLSFEEYFSTEKTLSERTESLNLTDIEKIENHGFNKKTSFRGR